ncbi:hypothetical protein LXA43DRAFT_1068413 [Ganoderma leucocontextum]|nr:hypothetical protein LXA43DRAFT_1068413 [Ganoderma leucocontextum]
MTRKSRAIIVNDEHHQVLVSVLNDGGEGRRVFTFEHLAKALKALGFVRLGKTGLIPPRRFGRKTLLLVPDGGRMDRVVSSKNQDGLKVALNRLYGWTAETFRSGIKARARAT